MGNISAGFDKCQALLLMLDWGAILMI